MEFEAAVSIRSDTFRQRNGETMAKACREKLQKSHCAVVAV